MQLSDWEQRPLSSQQIEYAALDAHCLVKIVEKISDGTGYDPLSCSESIKAIDTHPHERMLCSSANQPLKQVIPPQASGRASVLSLTTRLGTESVSQCVARRTEYQSAWMTRVTESHNASPVVSPQEVQRFWHQQIDKHHHSIARYQEQDPRFASISFVPYGALKTLQTSSEDRREMFRPVNSICLFAAGMLFCPSHAAANVASALT